MKFFSLLISLAIFTACNVSSKDNPKEAAPGDDPPATQGPSAQNQAQQLRNIAHRILEEIQLLQTKAKSIADNSPYSRPYEPYLAKLKSVLDQAKAHYDIVRAIEDEVEDALSDEEAKEAKNRMSLKVDDMKSLKTEATHILNQITGVQKRGTSGARDAP